MSKKKIGSSCEVLNGYAFKSKKYVDEGIRIIRIANVQKGYIEDNNPAFYPVDSEGLEKYMLEEDDLLISLTGNVGRVALLNSAMLPAALNQRVACLRLRDYEIDKKFLFHYLNSSVFENKCIQESKGVAQKNMSTEWLKRQVIPSYKLSEQKRITEILDRVIEVITAKNKQLHEYDQLIKSQFVEMFGDQKTNPKNWIVKTIGDVCILKSGTSLPSNIQNEGGVIPYVKVGDMNLIGNEKYITTSSRYVSEKTAGRGLFDVGTIIFPKRGGAIGTNKKRMTISPICADLNVMGVTPNELLDSIYLLAYFDEIDMGTLNNGSSVPQINNKDIAPLKICVPPLKLQVQFADFVRQVDKLKFEVQKSLDETQTLFDSLMQEYFG